VEEFDKYASFWLDEVLSLNEASCLPPVRPAGSPWPILLPLIGAQEHIAPLSWQQKLSTGVFIVSSRFGMIMISATRRQPRCHYQFLGESQPHAFVPASFSLETDPRRYGLDHARHAAVLLVGRLQRSYRLTSEMIADLDHESVRGDSAPGKFLLQFRDIPTPSGDWVINYRLRPAGSYNLRERLPNEPVSAMASMGPGHLYVGRRPEWEDLNIDDTEDHIPGPGEKS
jgi:hypothetical protein